MFVITEVQATALNAAMKTVTGLDIAFALFVDGQWVCEPKQFEYSSIDLDAVIVQADIGFADMASFADVPEAKEAKRKQIDARTVELIEEGFTYKGEVMSMSLAAQANYTSVHAMKGAGSLTLPLPWMNKNDTAAIVLQNVADIDGLADAAMTHAASIRVQGGQLKLQLASATTLAEVAAVVDNR